MKKRLLFSLLLGSAFIWTNELHTASEATAPAGEEKSAEKIEAEAKADAPKGEEEKKYKAIGLDGKEIEVQFFDKSKHPDLVLKKLFLQDGQAYSHCSDSDPRNVPYIAGELPPAGCAVVNVFRKNNNPDELKFMGPAVANGAVPDYAVKNEELWMYFDGKFLYPFDDVEDPNAKLILKNNEVKVYSYEIVDSENSAKAKELQEALKKSADLEEKLKTPGTGGGSPEDAAKVKELEARVEELKKSTLNCLMSW